MALLLTCLWRSDIIMVEFDESKHPRDESGKFISKDATKVYRQNTNYVEILRNTIKLPDETIPKSVGAKWVNEEIMMPNGDIAYFVEGTHIINRKVFAGKGCKRKIDEVSFLVEKYGGTEKEWMKIKANAWINYENESRLAEIHWYEEPSLGRKKIKFKSWEK